MRGLFLLLLLFAFIFAASPIAAQDSVTIIGQLHGACHLQNLKLREFSVTTQEGINIQPNEYGFFSSTIAKNGPGEMTLSSSSFRYDFFVTPDRLRYRLSVTCRDDGDFDIKVEDSPENEAFEILTKLQQRLVKDCDRAIHSGITADSLRHYTSQLFAIHDYNLNQVIHAYGGTFTASLLAPGCRVPESIPHEGVLDTMLLFMLKNPAWNDPRWFSNDLPLSIISILDKYSGGSDERKVRFVQSLLESGPRNDTAARLYQQMLFDFFMYRLDENALKIYSDWAVAHPGRIADPAFAYRIQKMQKTLPGSPLTDISLSGPDGQVQSLIKIAAQNKYTILLFWSSGCEHCMEELPRLQAFYQKYHPLGLEIYAVAIDSERDKWNQIIADKHLSWVNVYQTPDKLQMSEPYMITYTPTMVLCGRDGRILSRLGDLGWIERVMNAKGK